MRLAPVALLLLACSPPPHAGGPTYHRDVAPILAARCGDCHRDGPRAFTATSSPAWASAMLGAIDSGRMPPWQPGPASVPLKNPRAVTAEERATLAAWAKDPVLGDPQDAPPAAGARFDGFGPPHVVPFAYGAFTAEETRCFLLPVPAGYVRAVRWRSDGQGAIHHLASQLVSAAQAQRARAQDGADGRPGWDCPGGAVESNGTFGGGTAWEGFAFPDGYGQEVAPGSSVVVSVHAMPHAAMKMALHVWYLPGRPHTMASAGMLAPSETPCPDGITHDPANPCSREYASAHALPGWADASAKIITDCGQTLDDVQRLPYGPGLRTFPIVGRCVATAQTSGRMFLVAVHAHPNAVSARLEIEESGGAWTTLLDFPVWRWQWESTYELLQPIRVTAGQRVRLTCTYDNGTDHQPSALSGDWTPEGPRLPPRYRLWAPKKDDSMCLATWGVLP